MAEFDAEIMSLVAQLSDKAREKAVMIATAESCTGGLIAASITSLAGSSAVFERGFATYSNEAKNELLGVSQETLEQHGAVSEPTAAMMVTGALANSRADIAVSVTGVAGPGGGSAEKPVGLVYIGYGARDAAPIVKRHIFDGDREAIRRETVLTALTYIDALIDQH